jgi:DNA modification methylase
MIKISRGDCLKRMRQIPDGSVDMIMADPPYGMTACKWDSVIPLDLMWEHLNRVIKLNGAIVLIALQPFTTILINSNMKMFKYCWVWEQSHPSGFSLSKKRPLRYHGDICVWYKKQPTYNAQMWEGKLNHSMGKAVGNVMKSDSQQSSIKVVQSQQGKKKYPKSIQKFSNPRHKGMHPTQKPVSLMEYLIKTYTHEGELVLDFCMGSGTTGVACKNLNRDFIGIERDFVEFKKAKDRIVKTIFEINQKRRS